MLGSEKTPSFANGSATTRFTAGGAPYANLSEVTPFVNGGIRDQTVTHVRSEGGLRVFCENIKV